MSKVKVVGAELKEGEYQGNAYKNYFLYVVDSVKKQTEIFGVCPQVIKVKGKFVTDNDINVKSLNQKVCEFFYDRYGNITKIDIDE